MFLSETRVAFLRKGVLWSAFAPTATPLPSDPSPLSLPAEFEGVDISNLKVHQASRQLAFTAIVKEGKPLRNDIEPPFTSGVVYDSLFVRHWDQMTDPSQKSQLFVLEYSFDDSGHVLIENVKRPQRGCPF